MTFILTVADQFSHVRLAQVLSDCMVLADAPQARLRASGDLNPTYEP